MAAYVWKVYSTLERKSFIETKKEFVLDTKRDIFTICNQLFSCRFKIPHTSVLEDVMMPLRLNQF